MHTVLKFALPVAHLTKEQIAFFRLLSSRSYLEFQPLPILTHAGLCAAIEADAAQILWAPPLVALDLWEWGSAQPLATVVRKGRTSYPAVLVARPEPQQELATLLKGRVAWVSKLSAAGYVVPMRFLESEGLVGSEGFQEQRFLYSHQGVLQAVLQGQADVGATYGRLSRTSSAVELRPEAEGLRVVAVAGYVPNEVIMTSRKVSELERLSLGEALRRTSLGDLQLLGVELGVERFSLQVGEHLEPLMRLTHRARSSEIPLQRPLQFSEELGELSA
ncbi:MAG: PhnD/SsuA/transferrin family substrate-binding protein [Myxococcales bacterium]|nr:phosphate/phosphite/phosphonate ABC transporter substrate-binding protein [Polyangiaceae bacterium]MDW8248978.1 PhnD/SsuA/transferrin family substrate-binding protein [Myxococcales bacterium]